MLKTTVTLEQIAQEAGVSKQTVANVLNRTNKETWGSTARRAAKIREVATRMGYQPNGAAKAVRSGRFGCVGLLVSTRENSSTLPQAVWQGICDDLLEHNLHLTLFRMPDDDLLDPNRMPKILREWMADGMIVDYTHDVPQGLYDVIESSALPAVYVNTDRKVDCVKPDDFDAGYRATKLVIDRGHRRVMYADFHNIMVEGKTHYSAWERLAGYKRAMSDAGLEVNAVDGSGDGPRAAIKAALAGSECPTAVVCYGDLDAEYFVLAAAYAGLLIPKDLSIVTFGAKSCRFGGSEYTHFTIPEYEMGRRACTLLRSKIARDTEQHTVDSLPFGFVEGETVTTVCG